MAKKSKKNENLTLEEKLDQAFIPNWDELYKLPENWCWVKLGEIATFERGITFPAAAKEGEKTPKNIPCLRTANVQEYLDTENLLYVDKSYMKENENKLVRENDIIMSTANSRELVGKTSFVYALNEAMTFGGFIMAIRAKNINPKFLFYLLRLEFYNGKFMKNSTQTTNIANINTAILSECEVPLPPLNEQNRMVEHIENLFVKLDEAKEKAQEVIDGFENRKAATLHKAFSGELTTNWRKQNNKCINDWEVSTIGDIADVKGGKRVPKGMTLTSYDTGHPYIKAGNLKNGTVIDDEMMYVPDDVLPYIKNYTVNAGDVYITNVGACIGDCGIIPVKYDGANLTENAVKIINFVCVGEYLAFYLACNAVQQKIKELTASATLGKLSIAKIKTIEIHLPSREEQIEIVSIIKRIFAKNQVAKEKSEEVIEQIDLIKKAILARAFRGELGTNNPDEESAVELLKQILKSEENT